MHLNEITFRGSRIFMLLIGVAACLLLSADSSPAADDEKSIGVGDAAPAWEELPGTDDQKHSLADLKEKEIVVVVFTCNSCPYAVDYEDRLVEFAKEHCADDGKVALVAINVNTIEADLLPKMKERAEQKEFSFPYLFDETQQIARDFGAIYTPEFFVLNQERRIVYKGAMDDSTNSDNVTREYVVEAVAAALRGETPEVTENGARGCAIRFKRQRRTRKPVDDPT